LLLETRMSVTLPPAVRASLSIQGREDIVSPRFWLRHGVRVVMTLTDAATGAPVTGAAGVSLLVDRPGPDADDQFLSPAATEASPGVWIWDLFLDQPGAWRLGAESTAPRYSADRLSFDVVA
jgi:hypothetical protein